MGNGSAPRMGLQWVFNHAEVIWLVKVKTTIR